MFFASCIFCDYSIRIRRYATHIPAIFDVGLKHSSPSTILQHMSQPATGSSNKNKNNNEQSSSQSSQSPPLPNNITAERIKSHLQKYRLHRVKSKKEFISSYEASLRNYQSHTTHTHTQNTGTNNTGTGSTNHGDTSTRTIVSGNAEVAAHLTASVTQQTPVVGSSSSSGHNTDAGRISSNSHLYKNKTHQHQQQQQHGYHPKGDSSSTTNRHKSNSHVPRITNDGNNAVQRHYYQQQQQQQQQQHQQQNNNNSNDFLILPQLTEVEKQSPIGAAMGYLMGLFFSLKQQLMIQRSLEAAGEKAKGNAFFPQHQAQASHVSQAQASSSHHSCTMTNPATAAAVAAGVEFTASQQPPPCGMGNAGVGVGGAAMTNIEENSRMKRAMQNQMALQNKMRALKQQELAKYNHKNNQKRDATTTTTTTAIAASAAQHHHSNNHNHLVFVGAI